MTDIRPEMVDHLAEAYRHKGRSGYADLVIASRHADFSFEECREALARVLGEARGEVAALEAQRVVLDARLDLPIDDLTARLQALWDLPDDELEALHRAGALDDLDIDVGGDSP